MATGGAGQPGRGERPTGKCKWFHVAKGFGFITPDDGSPDVFVHQSVIQMRGFRSLAEDEKVEFESKLSDKGEEATIVCSLGGGDCLGSDRRPAPRRRVRKVRCYNCSEYGTHIASRCPYGPMPKRCHICKAEDHLVADCPNRQDKDDSGSDHGASGYQHQV